MHVSQTRWATKAELDQRVRDGKSADAKQRVRLIEETKQQFILDTVGTQQTESAACQSRENTTCPPAVADSPLKNTGGTRRNWAAVSLLLIAGLTLGGCTSPSLQAESNGETNNAGGSEGAPSQTPHSSKPSESTSNPTATPKDAAQQLKASAQPTVEPKPTPSASADFGGVAYEASGKELPQVARSGKAVKAADRLSPKMGSESEADYSDGVNIRVADGGKGTVKSEGSGFFTGAGYRVFEITLDNNSTSALDLNSVVVTLLLGDDKQIAMPLYGEIEAYDFAGSLDSGDHTSSKYAFIIPSPEDDLSLNVDLDKVHAPATFSVKSVKK